AEALTTYREAGDRQGIARRLEGSARLASAGSTAVRALRLGGAAAALRTAVGAPLPPAEPRSLDRHLAGAGSRGRASRRRRLGRGPVPADRSSRRRGIRRLGSPDAGVPEPAPADPLSPREREVAVLVARGLSNRAIAQELVIADATVERHIGNIFAKL